MKMVPISDIGTNTGKQYRYRRSVQIQKNYIVFRKRFKKRFQTLHNYQ